MPSSPRRSTASSRFRLEWRPSRWQARLLAVLTLLASLSLLNCALPLAWAVPAALAAAAWGGWQVRRGLRQPCFLLTFAGPDRPVLCGAEEVSKLHVHWRGPLAFVSWRDGKGRAHRAAWWPDTLPAARRRELRLATSHLAVSPRRRLVAP